MSFCKSRVSLASGLGVLAVIYLTLAILNIVHSPVQMQKLRVAQVCEFLTFFVCAVIGAFKVGVDGPKSMLYFILAAIGVGLIAVLVAGCCAKDRDKRVMDSNKPTEEELKARASDSDGAGVGAGVAGGSDSGSRRFMLESR